MKNEVSTKKPSLDELWEKIPAKARENLELLRAAGVPDEEIIKTYVQTQLAKLPSAEEQAKKDEADKKRATGMIEQAQMEEQVYRQTMANQQMCAHRSGPPANMHLWAGQVLSNGVARVACNRCQKAYYFMADENERKEGLAISPMENAGLNATTLEMLAKVRPVPEAKLNQLGVRTRDNGKLLPEFKHLEAK